MGSGKDGIKETCDDVLICRCEEIKKQEILKAIADGATDLRGIRIRTRAGMGLCQGKTCERNIRQIISQETGVRPEDLPPYRKRPPVRPLSLGQLENHDKESVK